MADKGRRRSLVKRFDSSSLASQFHPDSYAVVRLQTWAEAWDMAKEVEAEGFDNKEATGRLLKEIVRDWNWLDAEGTPLPLPRDMDEPAAELLPREVGFLLNAYRDELAEAEEKN